MFIPKRKKKGAETQLQRRVQEIKLDPTFKSLFPINKSVQETIEASIRKEGFNEEFPLVIWKEKDILIDGHTRLAAAKATGLKTIPVSYKSFKEKQDAIDYALTLQFHRRNLQDSDLFSFILTLDTDNLPGPGRKQERLARICGISTTKAVRILKVKKECTESQKAKILEGTLSVNSIYNKLAKSRNHVNPRKKSSHKPQQKIVFDEKQLLNNLCLWRDEIDTISNWESVFSIRLNTIKKLLPESTYVNLMDELQLEENI